jgi:hypothetical protein
MRDFERKQTVERTRDRIVVFEFALKLQDLANYFGCGNTIGALATFLDIPEKTLNDAKNAGGPTVNLHKQLTEKIAAKGKVFDPGWKEWRDPDADDDVPREKRGDTREKFLKAFREHPALGARDEARHGTVGAEHPLPEPAAAQPVPLVEDEAYIDAGRLAHDFAMLTVFAPTNAPPVGPGEVWVSFNLNCPATEAFGFKTWVTGGWLEFRLGTAITTLAPARTGHGAGVIINTVHFRVHDTDRQNPSWHAALAAPDAPMGLVGDAVPDFIRVLNLAPGAIVSARLRVCVGQLGSFSRPEDTTASVAKRKLRQRLEVLKMIEDDDGMAIVATSAIQLKAKPTAPDETRS